MNVKIIGVNIKKLREQNNLTQEELGNKIGLTASAVSNIEHNRSVPSVETLCLFSEFFQVTVDQLLSEYSQSYFEKYVLKEKCSVVDKYLSEVNDAEIEYTIGNRFYKLYRKNGCVNYQAHNLDSSENPI